MKRLLKKIVLSGAVALSILSISSEACTRVMCVEGDRVITARSMDWEENIPTSLWIFPKGINRDGGIDKDSIKWVSKYGSIITSNFDALTSDGMNSQGLVANLLWLGESDYGTSNKPTLSIGAFAQYVLDNYSNVQKAVEGLEKINFQIVAPILPGDDSQAALHLTISDPTGDSAILEFIKGDLVINHSKNYKVATNSPVYDQQLSINTYWEDVGGSAMLPGTHRPADRFARASFYTNNIIKNNIFKDERMAVSRAFSIIRESSVPFGINIPNETALPSTIWRTISDQKALKYYFDSVVSPSVFWVDINKLDLSENGKVKKLDLAYYPNYSGEVSNKFKNDKPFKWFK